MPTRCGHRNSPSVLGRGVLACLLLLGTAAGARAQAPITARLDSLFQVYSGADVPGCAVGLVQDGRLLAERAYGMADLEHDVRNDTATVFEAGSVSKQVTAAAVFLLAHRGRLKLSDEVRRWLPEVPLFHGRQMTVSDLLHHTSGLREWEAIVALRGWPQGSAAYTNAHVLDLVTRQRALNFEPATEFLYSNTNYDLLAVMVQRVSGRTLADFTRAEFFVPLGMTHTSWRDDYTRLVKGRAIGYARRAPAIDLAENGEDPPALGPAHAAMPNEDAYGSNGLLTTVGDLLRWNEELRTGAVLGPEVTRGLEQAAVLANGRALGYGAGLFSSSYRGVREVWHTGSIGGYRAFLARYPERKLSIAVLCNDAEVNPLVVGHRVADIALRDGAAKAAPEVPRASGNVRVPRGLGPVAGLYWDTRTGEAVRLVAEAGATGQRGSAVLVISATEFRLASNPLVRVIARSVPGRSRPRLLWITPDADTTILEPVDAFPRAADLNQYAGDWYSPEAEVTYTVAVQDGRLYAMFRPDVRFELTPIYADGFSSRGVIFRFERDGAGKVGGLGIWVPRARNIRFLHVIP